MAEQRWQSVARFAEATHAAPGWLVGLHHLDRLARDLAERGRELARRDRRADDVIDLAGVTLPQQCLSTGGGDVVARDVVALQVGRVGCDLAFTDIALGLAAET